MRIAPPPPRLLSIIESLANLSAKTHLVHRASATCNSQANNTGSTSNKKTGDPAVPHETSDSPAQVLSNAAGSVLGCDLGFAPRSASASQKIARAAAAVEQSQRRAASFECGLTSLCLAAGHQAQQSEERVTPELPTTPQEPVALQVGSETSHCERTGSMQRVAPAEEIEQPAFVQGDPFQVSNTVGPEQNAATLDHALSSGSGAVVPMAAVHKEREHQFREMNPSARPPAETEQRSIGSRGFPRTSERQNAAVGSGGKDCSPPDLKVGALEPSTPETPGVVDVSSSDLFAHPRQRVNRAFCPGDRGNQHVSSHWIPPAAELRNPTKMAHSDKLCSTRCDATNRTGTAQGNCGDDHNRGDALHVNHSHGHWECAADDSARPSLHGERAGDAQAASLRLRGIQLGAGSEDGVHFASGSEDPQERLCSEGERGKHVADGCPRLECLGASHQQNCHMSGDPEALEGYAPAGGRGGGQKTRNSHSPKRVLPLTDGVDEQSGARRHDVNICRSQESILQGRLLTTDVDNEPFVFSDSLEGVVRSPARHQSAKAPEHDDESAPRAAQPASSPEGCGTVSPIAKPCEHEVVLIKDTSPAPCGQQRWSSPNIGNQFPDGETQDTQSTGGASISLLTHKMTQRSNGEPNSGKMCNAGFEGAVLDVINRCEHTDKEWARAGRSIASGCQSPEQSLTQSGGGLVLSCKKRRRHGGFEDIFLEFVHVHSTENGSVMECVGPVFLISRSMHVHTFVLSCCCVAAIMRTQY